MSLEDRAVARLARIPLEPHLHRKRTLGVQARELLEAADAGADPAAVRIMLERHALELPDDRPSSASRTADAPARDPYVEVAAGAPPHALNDALIEAEAAAATATEVSDAPTRLRLARLAAERLEATVALEAGWGAASVDVSRYAALMALAAADRIEELVGEGGGSDEDPVL